LDLIDKRVLAVGQQLGRHLGKVLEVTVEDGPGQAGPIHHVTDGER